MKQMKIFSRLLLKNVMIKVGLIFLTLWADEKKHRRWKQNFMKKKKKSESNLNNLSSWSKFLKKEIESKKNLKSNSESTKKENECWDRTDDHDLQIMSVWGKKTNRIRQWIKFLKFNDRQKLSFTNFKILS